MEGVVKGLFTGQEGGTFPLDAETLQQLQDYVDGVAELANMYIPSAMSGAILSGCALESSGTRRGAGWLVLQGSGLVWYEGGLIANGLSVVEEELNVTAGGVTYAAYKRVRAVAGVVLNAKTYQWSDIADRTSVYDVKNEVMPIGMISLYGGSEAQLPVQWLPCDGRSVLIAEYPELFKVIGYKYSGGSTMGTSYKLPDISSLLLLPDVVGYVIRVK